VSDGSPNEAAKNIASSDIRWQHGFRVTENECCSSDMVRDDAETAIGLRIVVERAVALACDRFEYGENGGEGFGFVDRFFALEHSDGALDAHARVHAGMRKRLIAAVVFFVVLHEHVVPDFKVFAAMAAGTAVGPACGFAGIDKHFGVWTAWASFACGTPPVILTRQEIDSLFGYTKRAPNRSRFFITRNALVASEYSHRQLCRIDAQVLGACQKFVRPADCFFFKIVAERPVAEHLEKSEVTRIAYCVDIAGADALLVVSEALARRVRLAKQVRNERVHARGGKEHRGIVFGDEGLAAYLRMPAGLEKFNVFSA